MSLYATFLYHTKSLLWSLCILLKEYSLSFCSQMRHQISFIWIFVFKFGFYWFWTQVYFDDFPWRLDFLTSYALANNFYACIEFKPKYILRKTPKVFLLSNLESTHSQLSLEKNNAVGIFDRYATYFETKLIWASRRLVVS